MRILKISGTNLASLSEPFEIDLEAEPLRSSGLFAITGETGSGKSTILDAMCLGLYGDCPRLSADGVNDDVPDTQGDVIKSRDTRSILRRGAREGMAAVEFLANDGKRYCATWSVRRARGKADGKLQNPERSLTRLDDGVLLENQITNVRERVNEITGLTYEEFRRTVLLAQGDFDAFIRAGTQERAALLEKVTGTAIYRVLSQRIFDRWQNAQADLKAIESRRATTSVLSDEERAALEEDHKTAVKLAEELENDIKALTDAFRIKSAHAELSRKLAMARADEEAAKNASAGLYAMRKDLDVLRFAQDLREDHGRLNLQESDLAQTKLDLVEARSKCGSLEEGLEQAKSATTKAEKAHEEAEGIFKEFGPLWSRATELDGQIRTARNEYANAQEISRKAEAALNASAETVEALTQKRGSLVAGRDDLQRDLDRHPQGDQVAQRLEEIATLLRERPGRSNAEAAATSRAKTLGEEIDVINQSLGELDAADGKARQEVDRLGQKIDALEAGIAKTLEDKPRDRMGRLVEGASHLSEMIKAASSYKKLTAEMSEIETLLEEIRKAITETTAEKDRAKAEIARSEAAISVLSRPVETAEAAASAQASELRRRLIPGDPCPVCGSIEHPVLADEALARIARELRADFDKEKGCLEQAGRDLKEAETRLTINGLTQTEKLRRKGEISDEIANNTRAYFEARQKLIATGVERHPEEIAGALIALQDLSQDLETSKTQIRAVIEDLGISQDELEAHRKAVARIQREISMRQEKRNTLVAAKGEKSKDLTKAQEGARASSDRIAEIDVILSPLLEAAGLDTLLFRAEPANMGHALATFGKERSEKRANVEVIERNIIEVDIALGEARSTYRSARTAAEEAAIMAGTRKNVLDDLVTERSGLLGGEETEKHRSRHNEQRLAAQKTKDEAKRIETGLSNDLAAQMSRAEGLELEKQRLERAVSEGLTAINRRIEQKGLTRDTLRQLIQRGAAEIQRIEKEIAAIEEAHRTAIRACEGFETELHDMEESGIPEGELDNLQAKIELAGEQRKEATLRIGAAAARLQADNTVREGLRALDKDIDEAKAVLDTWRAVNEAVGSRSGGKFAQIAQTVTLGLLTERANIHLKSFKPRYSLIQGGEDLALQIIDHHMGGEIRSTRSLSGGERFLVSLSLALALSRLSGKGTVAATLFIDEGFGSLDAESLDVAIDALEAIQSQGRAIGVISHVAAMKERIPVQIAVRRQSPGRSIVEMPVFA